MTLLEEPRAPAPEDSTGGAGRGPVPTDAADAVTAAGTGEAWRAADTSPEPVAPAGTDGAVEPLPPVPIRPLIATLLTSISAALLVGGIFDSWGARLLGAAGAALGSGAVALTLRSRRQTLLQLLLPVATAFLASLTLVGAPGGPSNLTSLVKSAFDAGRLLHPPVPFDPGWRPIVFATILLLSYGAGWIGAAGDRPLIGVLVPMPLVLLASFTQPSDGQLLAAVFIFLPLLGALGVLFSAAGGDSGDLDLRFELKRASKAAVFAVPAIGLLVLFNSANFLFPAPSYNPNDKPQKPKPLPLSAETNQTLFTVSAPPGFTGPWQTGVLDVYDQGYFEIPPQASNDLVRIPADGVVDAAHAAKATVHVQLTTADLGDTPILPSIPTEARIVLPATAPSDLRLDTRQGVMRVTSGRIPSGLSYEIDLPDYPSAQLLATSSPPPRSSVPAADLQVPSSQPPGVQRILRDAPQSGWARLNYVRQQLLAHVTASGPGAPVAVSAAKVEDLIDGSRKGTPYEIVAAEALLSRWAGFPARIAYGFNGFDKVGGRTVVKADDAAQWLEVDFKGYGWVPLLDKPPHADTSLNNPHKPDQNVVAGNEVAAELFLPVGLPQPVPLFELVRARLLQALPWILLLLILRALAPTFVRWRRRRRREQWARAAGPRARVAVAYAELRDAATDLNVGDPFATPIEYLARVQDDEEHQELAWLVSRTMYGDLAQDVTEAEAVAAEHLSDSLRRRLRSGQPTQVQGLAFLTQASLRRPYTDEVPNLTLPAPGAALARRWNAFWSERAARRARKRLLRRSATTTRRRFPFRAGTA